MEITFVLEGTNVKLRHVGKGLKIIWKIFFLNCTITVYHFKYYEKFTTNIIKAKMMYLYKYFWL